MATIDESVDVVEYNAAWPSLFCTERERLAAVLGFPSSGSNTLAAPLFRGW